MNGLSEVKTETVINSKVEDLTKAKKTSSEISFIVKYFLQPIKAGIEGFAIILGVIIFTELIAYLLKFQYSFAIDINDILLSGVGFICFFLISLIRCLRKD